jgi:hypothetical protein
VERWKEWRRVSLCSGEMTHQSASGIDTGRTHVL